MPELQGTAVVQNKPPSAVALLKLPCLHRRDTSYSQSQQTAAWLGRQQTASGFPAGYCLLHVAIASYPRLLGFPRSLSGRAAKPHQIAHVITSVPPDPTLLWVLELSCFQLLLHENAPGTKYWCMPKDVPGMLFSSFGSAIIMPSNFKWLIATAETTLCPSRMYMHNLATQRHMYK